METQSPKPPYSQLGFAGAAFASLLVIVSLPARSPEVQRAVESLGTGIPLSVSSAYLAYLASKIEQSTLENVLYLARVLTGGFGDILCFLGVYWMIRSISPSVASEFLWLSLILYFTIASFELGWMFWTRKVRQASLAHSSQSTEPTATEF